MTIVFKNYSGKDPNKAFLVRNREIFPLDISEGADFNYDNSFLKF